MNTALSFLKDNWFKILVVAAIVGAFYWFQLRPAALRSECANLVARVDIGAPTFLQHTPGERSALYIECIRQRGLSQ